MAGSMSHLEFLHLTCYAVVFAFFAYNLFLWLRRNITLPEGQVFRVALVCMTAAVVLSIWMGNLLQAGLGAAFAALYYGQR